MQPFSPTGHPRSGTCGGHCALRRSSCLPACQLPWHWLLKAHSCPLLQKTGVCHLVQELLHSLGARGRSGEPVANDLGTHRLTTLPLGGTNSVVWFVVQSSLGIRLQLHFRDHILLWSLPAFLSPSLLYSHLHALSKSGVPESLRILTSNRDPWPPLRFLTVCQDQLTLLIFI